MKLQEFANTRHNLKFTVSLFESIGKEQQVNFKKMLFDFLPVAMSELKLKSLPTFKFQSVIRIGSQPSFGMYSPDDQQLHVALSNRHPVDILRTVAHELVHYRQDLNDELNDNSGITGSPEENQAHVIAGIILRNFNKAYPAYLTSTPLID
jgi:hypothetical protein